jgi:hypothetical protein
MGMLSIMSNCGSLTYGAVSAAINSGPLDPRIEFQSSPDQPQVLTELDLAKIVDGLKRRFAWYGFRSIELGPLVKIKDNTISIDLFIRGDMLGRVEVDQHWGGVTRWFIAKRMRRLNLSEALFPASRALPGLSRSIHDHNDHT